MFYLFLSLNFVSNSEFLNFSLHVGFIKFRYWPLFFLHLLRLALLVVMGTFIRIALDPMVKLRGKEK